MLNVASSLFGVAGSLQSKQNTGLSEQQQGYLFQTDVIIPPKTSQQAHARLVNKYTLMNMAPAKLYSQPLSHFSKRSWEKIT